MNDKWFKGLKYIICIIVLLAIYMILLLITNKIPSSKLENNIKESANVLVQQGELRKINLGYKTEYTFNFSDALMLNMAYSVDSDKPFDSMLLSRKDFISGVTQKENTIATENIGTDSRFINSKNGDVYHTEELYHFINYKDMQESFEYARYWHGYMLVLRPLLVFFNITQIRLLFTVILVGLSIALVALLFKKINLITAIIFIIGLFSCSVFMVGQSISEIPVFVVALVSSIILLVKKDVNKNVDLVFLIAGSIVGYMDLLTEPLVAIIFPLTVYFLVAQKNQKMTFSEMVKKYICLCAIWIIGYTVTWISKWVILDIIKNRGIFKQALEQITIRSDTKTKLYFTVLGKVIDKMSATVLCVSTLIPIGIMALYSSIRMLRGINVETNKMNVIPFVINMIMPFVWYAVIENHSYIHPFFCYKLLMLSIINLLILFSYILKLNRVKE